MLAPLLPCAADANPNAARGLLQFSTMATSRKIILSNGGYVGYVVVADDLMLSDLRNQINEQVDDCVMPPDYRFEAGALGPVSIKQEALAIDDFHTVKWLCDEEAKRSGSPDICVVGSNEETKTNSKTKSASSRVGPGFVSPPASKRANEGNGKSSKGRLGGLPKMILIGGSNFELKWLSTHEDAEKLVSCRNETSKLQRCARSTLEQHTRSTRIAREAREACAALI